MDQKFSTQTTEGEAGEKLGFLYNRLLANLDHEWSVQQSLLQLLEEERVALTQASTEAIEDTNARKESLILKEKENDAARRDIIEQIRVIAGGEHQKMTLSFLATAAPDEATAKRLKNYQQTLPHLVNTIRTHNRRNRELIHAALADTQGALQLIRSMVSPAMNYQKTGRFSTNAVQGTLIHQEG